MSHFLCNTSAPKLEFLPPTTAAVSQNVARAHVQACVWKKAMNTYPPRMDPKDFGWSLREGKQMVPLPIPDEVPAQRPSARQIIIPLT